MAFCSQCGHENPDQAQFCAACGQAAAGASAPAVPPGSGKKRSARVWVLAGLGLIVVAAGAVAVAAILQVSALTRNAVIVVVPEDAEMYVEVDLLEVSEENLQTLVDAYSEPAEGQEVDLTAVEDIFRVFDDDLYDEFRLTIEDDVQPWIGRHIAVAAFDTVPQTRAYTYGPDWIAAWAIPWADDEGEALMVIQVRDADLADGFLEDLAEAFEDQDWPVDDRTIQGVDFYEASNQLIEDEYVGEVIFGRSDDVILVSGSVKVLRDALEAQAGEEPSIADSEGFRSAMESLPGDPFVRGFWSEAGARQFAEGLGDVEEWNRRSPEAVGVVAAAVWFTPSGARSTVSVAVDSTKLPESGVAWLEDLGTVDPFATMPADRSAYYGVAGYNTLLDFRCDLTTHDWDCREAEDRRDWVSAGVTTQGAPGSQSRSLVMRRYVDASTAMRETTEESTHWNQAELVLERGDNALWVDGPQDARYSTSAAAVGDVRWTWRRTSETEASRMTDSMAEFELLETEPRLQIPAEAASALPSGTTTMLYLDGPQTVRELEEQFDESGYESYQDEADFARPIRWVVAGLRWDGDRLHASAAIEWHQGS